MPNIELAKEIMIGIALWYGAIPLTIAFVSLCITLIFLFLKQRVNGCTLTEKKGSTDLPKKSS